jgi:hypothetical protein
VSESESTPEAITEPAPEAEAAKTFTEDYVKELRAEIAKYRTRAKTAEGEIDNVRKSSLSEAERAVVEAEQRGRASVLEQYGNRLVRAAFIAEAARRNPAYDAEGVLDDLNLTRYLGEDGDPDGKAITAAVTRLVPEPASNPRPVGDADLGARPGPPLALNGDPLLQSIKQKLGIT